MARKILYDLVDEKGTVVGVGTRSDALRKQLAVKAVHIFLFNKKGELMVCRRPKTEERYPSMITSSAGGHVELGETHRRAALRELQEELGIRVALRDTGAFTVATVRGRTLTRVFTGRVGRSELKKLRPDSREVDAYWFQKPEVVRRDVQLHPWRYAKPFRVALRDYFSAVIGRAFIPRRVPSGKSAVYGI